MLITKGDMYHVVVGELTEDEIAQFKKCGYGVEDECQIDTSQKSCSQEM